MSDLFAPAKPADPRVHVCTACGRENAPCGMAGRWWCVPCAPGDYWPAGRGPR
jgi:hypothetical protein